MWGYGFLWPLLWLVILAVVVLGAVYLYRTQAAPTRSEPAMEVLRERYARGEISDEEFEERAAKLAPEEHPQKHDSSGSP